MRVLLGFGFVYAPSKTLLFLLLFQNWKARRKYGKYAGQSHLNKRINEKRRQRGDKQGVTLFSPPVHLIFNSFLRQNPGTAV
jgi:hypothetical protein